MFDDLIEKILFRDILFWEGKVHRIPGCHPNAWVQEAKVEEMCSWHLNKAVWGFIFRRMIEVCCKWSSLWHKTFSFPVQLEHQVIEKACILFQWNSPTWECELLLFRQNGQSSTSSQLPFERQTAPSQEGWSKSASKWKSGEAQL